MPKPIRIEPTDSKDFGPCDCCGSETRRVWGFAHTSAETVAAYFVQWTVGRVDDHGALFDLILGKWGDAATAADRSLVTLDYRLLDNGPAFMAIDSAGRPAATSDIVGHTLARAEVIGKPIAKQAFTVADAILGQDERVRELLGPFTLT